MIAKKSLGQHFLTNTAIVASIAGAGGVSSCDTVLEIGPGKGILTAELLKRGSKVIAVEKDKELVMLLKEMFKKEIREKRLFLVNDDILDFRPENYNLRPETYKVVANIPYYITGAIIRKFLSGSRQPEKMALLVQKEVAERIIAKDKKESLLSLSVKAYGEPKYIKTVRAGSFTPPPKVDSAILLIDNISRNFFLRDNTTVRFFEIIHAGFAHKRKQLQGNLKAVFEEKILEEKLARCGIPGNARAEDISLAEWMCLAN